MWCCQARWESTLVVGIQTPAEAPWTLPRDLEGFPGCHVQPNCLPLPTSDDAPDDDADLGQAPPRRRRLRRCNMNRGKDYDFLTTPFSLHYRARARSPQHAVATTERSIRLVRCYREPKYLPSFANVTLSTGLWAAGRRTLADMSLIASRAQRVAMHVCGAEGRVASKHELLGEDSATPTHPHAIPPNGMFTHQCPHKIVTTDGVLPNLVLSMRPSLGSSAKAPQGCRTLAASPEDRSIPTVC